MANIAGKNIDELCAFLKSTVPDLESGVIQNIKLHKISGELFLQLSEEYLREIAPLLGDRLQLRKIISGAHEPLTPLSEGSVSRQVTSLLSHGTPEVTDVFEVISLYDINVHVFPELNIFCV